MTAVPGLLVRRLLVLLAAMVLAGPGAVELTPRPGSGGASLAATAAGTATAGRAAAPRPAAESQPIESGSTVRTALAAAVSSSGGEPLTGPGSLPLSTPRRVSPPVVRPPSSDVAAGTAGGPTGRAPPGAAGT